MKKGRRFSQDNIIYERLWRLCKISGMKGWWVKKWGPKKLNDHRCMGNRFLTIFSHPCNDERGNCVKFENIIRIWKGEWGTIWSDYKKMQKKKKKLIKDKFKNSNEYKYKETVVNKERDRHDSKYIGIGLLQWVWI